jgi:transposase
MDNEPFNASDTREWRRMQAWRLKQLGWKQRDIAVALGASEGAVSQWLAAARAGGPDALLSRSASGHPAKLSADQRRLLPDFLWHGPES